MKQGSVAPTSDASRRFGQLPPMPQVAARVLELINDPDSSPEDLHEVIEADPALASAVLRLVNSALFGVDHKVTSVGSAILMIGFLRLRSLTLATVVAGLRDGIPPGNHAERDLIWNHSVSVAIGARLLADRAGLMWSEEAFTAGLLHDCGRMIMLAGSGENYAELVAQCGGLPSIDEERARFDVDHVTVGAALLGHWGLPAQLIAAVTEHHDAVIADGPHRKLVALVALADRLLDDDDGASAAALMQLIELPAGPLDKLADELRREVVAARGELLAL